MKRTGQTCSSATPKARPDKNISRMTSKYVRRITKKRERMKELWDELKGDNAIPTFKKVLDQNKVFTFGTLIS